jgi:hypothetical protein
MPSEKEHIENIKMQAIATVDPVKKNSVIVEDFNYAQSVHTNSCVKCVKIEMKKIIDSFPAIKSLKIEPALHPLLENR